MGAAPIWVVAERRDAERFAAAPPTEGRVLPITPTARAILRGCGLLLLDPRQRFTNCAHARVIAEARRARQQLLAAIEAQPGRNKGHREIALQLFHRAAYTSGRIWFTLGRAGPWMIPSEFGWDRCEARTDAHCRLVRNILGPRGERATRVLPARAMPFPRLYRALRRLVLKALCRGRINVLVGARKSFFGLLEELTAHQRVRVVVATRAQGSWGDYGRLLRELWRGMRGGRETQIALVVDQRKRAASVADALIESVENPVLREGFRHFAATLADGWSQAGPALRDARKIVAATEAAHFVSAEVSGPMEWALAEAAGERGALRWVLSRNTHAPATSALALDSTRVYFKARYPDGLVDRYLFWTPGGAATARQFLPDERWPLIEAVAAVPVNPVAQESNGEMRRVLVADTLATFWLPLSWIYQTADEFIDGLGALIEAVEKSPKTELAIRAKLRPEIELDAYAKLLRASPRVTVKARDFDFARDLAQADLLIASRSTTIEEAIHGRRPVLLWGGSRHYRYMPARETPPRPGDRAAVYAANGAEHLALMLRAILECHSGIPLTDQEMAAYVWPDRTPTITDLAARLVSRPQRHVRPAELEMAPPRQ